MIIHKFSIKVADTQEIEMTAGAKILTVQYQNDILCIWALVMENETRKEKRIINVYGTGNPLPDQVGDYIGTVQTYGGNLVWHVFEVKRI